MNTDLLLERRPVLHGVHNSVGDASVELSHCPLGIETEGIVATVNGDDQTLNSLHVAGPREIDLRCWLGQATPVQKQNKK